MSAIKVREYKINEIKFLFMTLFIIAIENRENVEKLERYGSRTVSSETTCWSQPITNMLISEIIKVPVF